MATILENERDLNNLILEAEEMVERRKPEALQAADKVKSLALQTNVPRSIAHAKYIEAFYHCLVANDYDLAIALCSQALKDHETDDIDIVCFGFAPAIRSRIIS